MSANVETMFSANRIVPWHGLGVVLDNPPSANDAIVAAGLNWEVEKKSIFREDGTIIPGYFSNVRTSDSSVLGIVSAKYTVVQNYEAFSFVDELLGEGLRYETCGALRQGRVVWLLAKMPETEILGDKFEPYLCFTNSHDGSGAIRVCATPTRVVCSNTLNLALKSANRSWSTKHVGDMAGKMNEARETLGLSSKYITELQIEAERLAAIKISDAEVESFLDAIYLVKDDDSDIRKARIAKAKDSFFTCLDAADIKQFRGTAYGLINAATDFVDHAEPMRKTANFEENRWAQIIVGHPFVDQMYKKVVA